MEWYSINNIEQIDSPAMAVYPQRVTANIQAAIAQAGGASRLRPHVKTNKTAEVCRLMLQQGITKFKCATITEAEMLAGIQAPDVLLAYQPVGPKINRLLQLVQNYPATQFSCLVDDAAQAIAIAAVFAANNAAIGVFIDLNIGMNRTGIPPGDAALQLYNACSSLDGLQVKGLHAYDGHIHDNDAAVRKTRADQAFVPVAALAGIIHRQTNRRPVIIAGGSPTFAAHALREEVECSPGTFVFWDWSYHQMIPEAGFLFAAVLLTRIISIPDKHTVCLDLGHKSVAPEMPLPRVHFLNQPEGAEQVSQSEEHLVVRVADATQHAIGDVWYGIPRHICPSISMYDTLQVVDHNEAVATWKVTARGK